MTLPNLKYEDMLYARLDFSLTMVGQDRDKTKTLRLSSPLSIYRCFLYALANSASHVRSSGGSSIQFGVFSRCGLADSDIILMAILPC